MIRVCVLGSIGSGKSFIAKLFNYPVFNADKEVNYIYKKDKQCFKKLKKKLPEFIKTFPIKKKELINAISKDNKNLKIISSIVHPIVRKKMYNFINKKKYSKIVILDIPLLIENKLNKKNDILVFIKAHNSKIISRLKRRKNYNKKILENLKQNQTALKKKERLANYIVENNFSYNIMKSKIKLIRKSILDERNSSRY